MGRRWGVLLPIAVLALAAFFRLYQLDSIPPGLWRDEARNGVDVLGIFNGVTPIFFEDREPFYLYLAAGFVAAIGPTQLALHLPAAFLGIAIVGLTYLLASKLFDRWIALLAALGLSTSFWHVDISRLALRVNSLPLFAMLSFYFLWVGLKRDRASQSQMSLLWPFLLSGLFLGISFYTYLSSRLLPLAIVLFLAWAVGWRSIAWRRGLLILSTIGIISALVFAPLGSYFLDHPDAFLQHAAETSFFGSGPGTWAGLSSFLANFAKNLGMFSFSGDFNWRHNIAFRPVFDPVSSVFFISGLLYAFYRVRRQEYAFLIIWLAVALLPGIASIDSPHFLRTLAAAPAAYILSAIGTVRLGQWLTRLARRLRLPTTGLRYAYAVAIAAAMLTIAIGTYRDYFLVWANSTSTYSSFESEVTASGKFLNTLQGEPLVFVSAVYVPHPALIYLSRPFTNLLWYDSYRSLVLPLPVADWQPSPAVSRAINPSREAIFVVYGDNSPWLSVLERAYPNGAVIATGRRPDGVTSFSAYRAPDFTKTGATIEPQNALKVNWGGLVQLAGYDLRGGSARNGVPALKPGEVLSLTLYWQPLKAGGEKGISFFTHLTDLQFATWGQEDSIGYDSSQWRGGELVITRFDIRLKEGVPPGKYFLRVGLYSQMTMDRFQILDNGSRPTGDVLSLSPIKVLASSSAPPKPQVEYPATLGKSAQLLGYDLGFPTKDARWATSGPARPGEKLRVTLYWRGARAMKEDYTIFLHLTKPSGEPVAQADAQPAKGAFPTSFWDEGEYVADLHELAIPPDVPPGEYTLVSGIYFLDTGERLVTDTGADSVRLGTISIR